MANEIILQKNYAEVCIYNVKNEVIYKTKIDLEDIFKVKKFKWKNSHGYVTNSKHRLHRYIMNCPEGMVVDHINHDKTDNRKNNLRICSYSQNAMNNSKTKGVTWDKSRNKWRAELMLNYKHVYSKRFEKKEDAIKARKDAEKKYFKEFAYKENLLE